jgi:hypothetical protein
MQIKDTLKKLNPPITDSLPLGAINELADQHNFARQTITRMLKGETGSEENVREVLASVAGLALQAGQDNYQLAELINTLLNTEPETA